MNEKLSLTVLLKQLYLIFFCSVRSPSLTSIADSSRRVELADFDWLFFIPNNQRTSSLMACTCGKK